VRFVFNPGWGPGPTNQWCSIQGTVQPLLKYATIWMPYSHWLWDDKAPQSLELMKSHSEQVWFYEIMNFTYTRRPTVGRDMLRTLAWTAWKYRLQGASWYSLNAISRTPYADDAKGDQYGAVYYTVPARSLEALRHCTAWAPMTRRWTPSPIVCSGPGMSLKLTRSGAGWMNCCWSTLKSRGASNR